MTSAHRENYTPGRTQAISFLVLHYTAGRNDSARGNVRYFAENAVHASAHYFVDEKSWMQSVDDGDTAWSVGTAGVYRQKHPLCRNANSISIELCCRFQAGAYSFAPQTVQNAARLVRLLMARYELPVQNVLRHYDVVSKRCPAPWVDDEAAWETFLKQVGKEQDVTKEALFSLDGTGDEPSAWAREATAWARARGLMLGDGKGNFGWQTPVTREMLAAVLQRLAQKQPERTQD